MKLPELLAPAGTPECLDAAVGCGADAVYLGLKSFNARLRSANFSYAQYEAALRSLHKTGRKLYVAVNTVFQERESDRVYQLLQYLEKTGADGVIVQDLGVLKMIHDFFPALAVHASTQMNISSAHGANVLSKYGVRRVVLARELSLEEIAGVASGSSVEMEVFVHGALCLSASGLCLFSSFLGGKSANRGMCTQACRRQYAAGEEAAGYYFSPPDLQLLGSVRELAETGVAALKIEGRMKSAEYVAAVTSAYRRVLDALATDSEEQYERALKEGERLLRADFARAKTNYRISGGAENPPERWLNPAQSGGAGIYLGAVRKTSTRGGICRVWLPGTEHTLEAGDTIRVHSAGDTRRVTHKITSAEPAPSGGERGQWLSAPEGVREGDEVYVIQKKAKHRYAPVLPRDLSPYKKQPGFDSAPPPNQSPCRSGRKKEKAPLPEGLYIAVSCIEDLYIAQSARGAPVILPLHGKSAAALLGRGAVQGGTLPIPPSRILLNLDPITTSEADNDFAETLPALYEHGYRTYIVNNLSQFGVLKNCQNKTNIQPAVIAGPYIYTFNRYAACLAAETGADYFISPYENSRQNLEKTYPQEKRRAVFVTAYSRPPLFRIRSNIAAAVPAGRFADSQGGTFHLRALEAKESGTNSIVSAETAFSILDKTPFLKEAGFRRFILDFSAAPLKKIHFKETLKRAASAACKAGESRFNWKNGFYEQEPPRTPALENAD